jgi:hypothetical protein
MNRDEWLECSAPYRLLDYLRDTGRLSERKARLFEVACCRRIWHLIGYAEYRHIVEVAERFADGEANQSELDSATKAAYAIAGPPGYHASLVAALQTAGSCVALWPGYDTEDTSYSHAAFAVAVASGQAVEPVYSGPRQPITLDPKQQPPADLIEWITPKAIPEAMKAEYRAQAGLLRDMFGDPFTPLSTDASWVSPKVVQLAQEIYNHRSFDRMPELAAVLEAAGCAAPDLLAHCRQATAHVRGCWVLDTLLGKM